MKPVERCTMWGLFNDYLHGSCWIVLFQMVLNTLLFSFIFFDILLVIFFMRELNKSIHDSMFQTTVNQRRQGWLNCALNAVFTCFKSRCIDYQRGNGILEQEQRFYCHQKYDKKRFTKELWVYPFADGKALTILLLFPFPC